MTDLKTIVELSHEFGTVDYVKGGGGNTSVKNATTLWVKPSGTTLAGLTEETFVAMNRAKINELYAVATPKEAAAREELVKNLMAAAVVVPPADPPGRKNSAGRPSVEAPLHNVFEAKFVVHTHPCAVNGLTCAKGGEAACKKLFPEALWVEYIDPGYTLCMEVRKHIEAYKTEYGKEPALLVLKNHGIFIAADTAAEIRALYTRVMNALNAAYKKAGISQTLEITVAPQVSETEANIRTLFGADASFVASSGTFPVAPGPITPDHLVYAKAFPFAGKLTAEAVAAYKAERGYAPKVVIAGKRVYGIGTSQKNADLALVLAQDGALVMKLADAFGGIEYMTDASREFIENWEVESYRQSQAG
jgi:rhamnose utilization protein RhaD (predicted bifunctional aldolase and dehydrogenase)